MTKDGEAKYGLYVNGIRVKLFDEEDKKQVESGTSTWWSEIADQDLTPDMKRQNWS